MASTTKERKVNSGATNLSARTVHSERGTVIKPDFVRSWTHKLISPDEYIPKEREIDSTHVYKNTATWRPVPILPREFKTVHTESYRNPKDVPKPFHFELQTPEEINRLKTIEDNKLHAVETLCRTAKAHFGTTASMMKAVSEFFVMLFDCPLVNPVFYLYFISVQQEERRQYNAARIPRILQEK